jgi:hypothetical protein
MIQGAYIFDAHPSGPGAHGPARADHPIGAVAYLANLDRAADQAGVCIMSDRAFVTEREAEAGPWQS